MDKEKQRSRSIPWVINESTWNTALRQHYKTEKHKRLVKVKYQKLLIFKNKTKLSNLVESLYPELSWFTRCWKIVAFKVFNHPLNWHHEPMPKDPALKDLHIDDLHTQIVNKKNTIALS